MFCPFCNAADTRVVDSRLVANGCQVKRRRECSKCKERYTSFEVAELLMPKVIKKTGFREPFDDLKVRLGLQKAIEKRPISMEQLEASLSVVSLRVRAAGEREIDSKKIGEIVMQVLFELDLIAYVRFASVYWEFKDLQSFTDFVNNLDYSDKCKK